MRDKVIALRLRIDGLAQLTEGLEPGIKKQQGYYINKDIGKEEILIFANSDQIDKVDWLREQIKNIVELKEIENHPDREVYFKTSLMWFYFEAKKHLMEARFWLGFELERIRKDHLNK